MNSFEKLFSDAIDSFKKFFYSIYLLVCKPSVIVYSSFTPSKSTIIAPISFFIVCEAVFYAFLRSVVNAYEQANVFKASMEALQKIDFVSFIIILIPTVIFIYLTIQVFSLLFIKDINQKQLFYNMAFYYSGIGLLISSGLIILKYYLIPPRFESMGLSDEVNYLNGDYDNWRIIDYALVIADNIICVLIPAVFIYKLTRISKIFRWYYLLLILFPQLAQICGIARQRCVSVPTK